MFYITKSSMQIVSTGTALDTERIIQSASTTYNPMDQILALMVGDFPNVSNSLPGDWGEPNLTNLQRAQEAKMAKYFEMLNLSSGKRVFEIGPGWGHFAKYCRDRGVHHVSVVPAQGQYEYLKAAGFEVFQNIWQNFTPEGQFDAVVSMGSVEHFVSPVDHLEGRQNLIYEQLFRYAHGLLKPGGRYAGQFMDFCGNKIDYSQVSVKAPKGSMYYHLGLLEYFYPESWIPRNFQHFFYESNGEKYFEVLETIDGRLQYIWTMQVWGERFRELYHWGDWSTIAKEVGKSISDSELRKKWSPLFGLLGKIVHNKQFRYWARAFWEKSNRTAFEQEWMGHTFFFLQKK